MTTMREVVEDALEEIGVKTAEIALTSDELQSGIRRANDMLLEWADLGLTPSYQEVIYGDDSINVDRNAISAIKYSLAMRLAPSFQKNISQALAMLASETKSALETSSVFIGRVAYPDTLPTGSGNDCQDRYLDDRFFPRNKEENF